MKLPITIHRKQRLQLLKTSSPQGKAVIPTFRNKKYLIYRAADDRPINILIIAGRVTRPLRININSHYTRRGRVSLPKSNFIWLCGLPRSSAPTKTFKLNTYRRGELCSPAKWHQTKTGDHRSPLQFHLNFHQSVGGDNPGAPKKPSPWGVDV